MVFVANVLKCRPPGNRDPMPDEIEACESHLFRQVELIEPKVVATLGNFSTKLLSGKQTGITRVHGQAQEVTLGGRKVLLYPLYHPAAALYTPSMLNVLREDFARHSGAARPGPRAARRARAAARRRARRPARPLLASTGHGARVLLARGDRAHRGASSRPSCGPATSSRSPASSARARRHSCAAPAARSASRGP